MEALIKNYENKLPGSILKEFKKEANERKLTTKQAEKVLAYLEEQYTKAKIHPGEAIGVVTAESFGEPGTQMSIHGDERIIIKFHDKIHHVSIGSFVDGLIDTKGYLAFNDSEIVPLHDLEVYVPSLNHNEKVEWKRVIECSRHTTSQPLLKITTASGRVITSTDNHSFVTRMHNAIIPIKGSDLKIGDRLPVWNHFSLGQQRPLQSVDISSYITVDTEHLLINNGILMRTGQGARAKHVANSFALNWQHGWLIGAYLAEGCSNGHQFSLSNVDDTYMAHAQQNITAMGLDYREDFHHRGYGESRDLKVNSSLLAQFIANSCGSTAHFKRVPDFAFNASDEFVGGLLRGYFDGDANFHVSRNMIRVSSSSKNLRDGIASLLSRFKIFSYKTTDKKNQFWLLIPYKYAPLFLAHIGSDIPHKKTSLETLASSAKHYWETRSQDYTDMISGFDTLFFDTAKLVGLPTRMVRSFTKRQKIGRTALYRYIKIFDSYARKKGIDISAQLDIMKQMFSSDTIWDEIVDLEPVHFSGHVYDLSVPGLETFTTSEGIVIHNTLNVFHFAGVAEVSVTQGLPRLIEILDARKEISTPSMEIFLKSSINKDPKEVKRVAALIKETKLHEIVSAFSINLIKLQVELEMDKAMMRDLKIKEDYVERVLTESLKNVKVKSQEGLIILKAETEENELMETYKLKEKIKDLYIKGVKGIQQVLPVKNNQEFVIITSGSNLKDVLELEDVDETRTTTNDVFEVLSVLGVEAARQILMNEATKVIEDQGLDVDVRHIMLVSDSMTQSGDVKGITRGGITGEKKSVLARASFETPMKHLVHASLVGEEDELNSVIENVMLNQPVPVGTGLPDLVAKMKGLFGPGVGLKTEKTEKKTEKAGAKEKK